MQLNIKKYESVNIYVLLQNDIIIGIYTNIDDANAAKLLIQKKYSIQYKHKDADDWIRL